MVKGGSGAVRSSFTDVSPANSTESGNVFGRTAEGRLSSRSKNFIVSDGLFESFIPKVSIFCSADSKGEGDDAVRLEDLRRFSDIDNEALRLLHAHPSERKEVMECIETIASIVSNLVGALKISNVLKNEGGTSVKEFSSDDSSHYMDICYEVLSDLYDDDFVNEHPELVAVVKQFVSIYSGFSDKWGTMDKLRYLEDQNHSDDESISLVSIDDCRHLIVMLNELCGFGGYFYTVLKDQSHLGQRSIDKLLNYCKIFGVLNKDGELVSVVDKSGDARSLTADDIVSAVSAVAKEYNSITHSGLERPVSSRVYSDFPVIAPLREGNSFGKLCGDHCSLMWMRKELSKLRNLCANINEYIARDGSAVDSNMSGNFIALNTEMDGVLDKLQSREVRMLFSMTLDSKSMLSQDCCESACMRFSGRSNATKPTVMDAVNSMLWSIAESNVNQLVENGRRTEWSEGDIQYRFNILQVLFSSFLQSNPSILDINRPMNESELSGSMANSSITDTMNRFSTAFNSLVVQYLIDTPLPGHPVSVGAAWDDMIKSARDSLDGFNFHMNAALQYAESTNPVSVPRVIIKNCSEADLSCLRYLDDGKLVEVDSSPEFGSNAVKKFRFNDKDSVELLYYPADDVRDFNHDVWSHGRNYEHYVISSDKDEIVKFFSCELWADANKKGRVASNLLRQKELAKLRNLHYRSERMLEKIGDPRGKLNMENVSLHLDLVDVNDFLGNLTNDLFAKLSRELGLNKDTLRAVCSAFGLNKNTSVPEVISWMKKKFPKKFSNGYIPEKTLRKLDSSGEDCVSLIRDVCYLHVQLPKFVNPILSKLKTACDDLDALRDFATTGMETFQSLNTFYNVDDMNSEIRSLSEAVGSSLSGAIQELHDRINPYYSIVSSHLDVCTTRFDDYLKKFDFLCDLSGCTLSPAADTRTDFIEEKYKQGYFVEMDALRALQIGSRDSYQHIGDKSPLHSFFIADVHSAAVVPYRVLMESDFDSLVKSYTDDDIRGFVCLLGMKVTRAMDVCYACMEEFKEGSGASEYRTVDSTALVDYSELLGRFAECAQNLQTLLEQLRSSEIDLRGANNKVYSDAWELVKGSLADSSDLLNEVCQANLVNIRGLRESYIQMEGLKAWKASQINEEMRNDRRVSGALESLEDFMQLRFLFGCKVPAEELKYDVDLLEPDLDSDPKRRSGGFVLMNELVSTTDISAIGQFRRMHSGDRRLTDDFVETLRAFVGSVDDEMQFFLRIIEGNQENFTVSDIDDINRIVSDCGSDISEIRKLSVSLSNNDKEEFSNSAYMKCLNKLKFAVAGIDNRLRKASVYRNMCPSVDLVSNIDVTRRVMINSVLCNIFGFDAAFMGYTKDDISRSGKVSFNESTVSIDSIRRLYPDKSSVNAESLRKLLASQRSFVPKGAEEDLGNDGAMSRVDVVEATGMQKHSDSNSIDGDVVADSEDYEDLEDYVSAEEDEDLEDYVSAEEDEDLEDYVSAEEDLGNDGAMSRVDVVEATGMQKHSDSNSIDGDVVADSEDYEDLEDYVSAEEDEDLEDYVSAEEDLGNDGAMSRVDVVEATGMQKHSDSNSIDGDVVADSEDYEDLEDYVSAEEDLGNDGAMSRVDVVEATGMQKHSDSNSIDGDVVSDSEDYEDLEDYVSAEEDEDLEDYVSAEEDLGNDGAMSHSASLGTSGEVPKPESYFSRTLMYCENSIGALGRALTDYKSMLPDSDEGSLALHTRAANDLNKAYQDLVRKGPMAETLGGIEINGNDIGNSIRKVLDAKILENSIKSRSARDLKKGVSLELEEIGTVTETALGFLPRFSGIPGLSSFTHELLLAYWRIGAAAGERSELPNMMRVASVLCNYADGFRVKLQSKQCMAKFKLAQSELHDLVDAVCNSAKGTLVDCNNLKDGIFHLDVMCGLPCISSHIALASTGNNAVMKHCSGDTRQLQRLSQPSVLSSATSAVEDVISQGSNTIDHEGIELAVPPPSGKKSSKSFLTRMKSRAPKILFKKSSDDVKGSAAASLAVPPPSGKKSSKSFLTRMKSRAPKILFKKSSDDVKGSAAASLAVPPPSGKKSSNALTRFGSRLLGAVTRKRQSSDMEFLAIDHESADVDLAFSAVGNSSKASRYTSFDQKESPDAVVEPRPEVSRGGKSRLSTSRPLLSENNVLHPNGSPGDRDSSNKKLGQNTISNSGRLFSSKRQRYVTATGKLRRAGSNKENQDDISNVSMR